MEDRIIKLEVEMEALGKSVDRLTHGAELLTQEVRNIQKVLTQIKYFAMGMGALYAMDSTGVLKIIQMLGV